MLFLLLIAINLIYIIYHYINIRYFLPKRKINIYNIKKILIGLPTIDRDKNLFKDFYNSLKKSIENIEDIKFDLLVVTREKDQKVKDFWKDKSKIKTIDNYEITNRHNLNKLSKKFNIIKNYSKENNYDALIIIESDIIIEKDTVKDLIDSLKKAHVILFPFVTPWTNFPIILENSYYYKFNNSRKINKKEIDILGHGTGCLIINKDVIKDKNINFNNKKIFNIEGQDIGFFDNLHKNLYKVKMINKELFHAYY